MFKHTQLCFHSTSQLFCPQHVAPPRGAPHLMVAEDPDVESVPAAETAAVESDEAEVQKKQFWSSFPVTVSLRKEDLNKFGT